MTVPDERTRRRERWTRRDASVMKIAINTLSVTPDKGGIRTYLVNVVHALVQSKPHHHYRLLCSPVNEALFRSAAESGRDVSLVRLPLGSSGAVRRIGFDQLVVPRRLGPDVDLLLTPSNISTVATGVPQIVVVQAPLAVRSIRAQTPHADEIVSRGQRLYYDLMMPISMRKADHVVAVSSHLAEHIRRSWPDSASKVTIIHEGVEAAGFEHGIADGSVGDPYVLFVSTLFPYKNANRLIEAFALLKSGGGGVPDRLRLRIAGRDPDGRQRRALEELAARQGVAAFVDLLGAVPHEEIADLYRGARAFVFPSAVETFGLPVLEAMASGVPVVASDRMSVPEVVGDAGLVVDPDSPSDLARAIERVLADEGLRSALVEAGRLRVRELSWQRVAERFDALFTKVVAR
jgi:glycosyltransferase involved in cell wall biosynthesis